MILQIAKFDKLKEEYIKLLDGYGLEYAHEYYTYYMQENIKKAGVIELDTEKDIESQLREYSITKNEFIRILIANLEAFKIVEDKVLKDSFLYTSTLNLYPQVGDLLHKK